MKTAEEWIKKLYPLPPRLMTVEWRVSTIKEIQLDALREAAEIARMNMHRDPYAAILARIKEVEG